MPKVSVIIPVYGVEKYLKQCLESVLTQTLKDIEIILVDDGSKDNCPKICDEYAQKDSRIIVIHKENSGYGHSINKGIDKAKGDYIGIVDADDWVDPEMFENLYLKAIEMGAELVKADFYKYSGNKNTNKIAHIIPSEVVDTLIEPIKFNSVMSVSPSIWTAIYKKEFLTKNNIHLSETPSASYQDTGFHFKTFLSAKKAYFLNKAFYHYRIDNAASSVKDTKKVFYICDEWQGILSWAKEKGIYHYVSGLLCALQYKSYMWNWKRLSGEGKKMFLKRFSEDFIIHNKQHILKKEDFKTKDYKRLQQIMYYPAWFSFIYKIQHFPHTLLKEVSGGKNG